MLIWERMMNTSFYLSLAMTRSKNAALVFDTYWLFVLVSRVSIGI